MTLDIFRTAQAAAKALAQKIIALVELRPDAVLGLATGATMEPVYAELIRAYEQGVVSFRQVTTFNLDEYAGLPASDAGSYRSTMDRLFFSATDIIRERTHLPDGMAEDLDREGAAYETRIRAAGGIDLQILGIGRNGHIGFNEPGSAFDSRTRPVDLHVSTLDANAGFFGGGKVPGRAITMGLGTILEAREICLLATGASKAPALARALEGPVRNSCPASILSRHPRVTWLADQAAAAKLAPRSQRT